MPIDSTDGIIRRRTQTLGKAGVTGREIPFHCGCVSSEMPSMKLIFSGPDGERRPPGRPAGSLVQSGVDGFRNVSNAPDGLAANVTSIDGWPHTPASPDHTSISIVSCQSIFSFAPARLPEWQAGRHIVLIICSSHRTDPSLK